ncbi:MAG: hypothetical protein V2A76_05025 [Planctomycetota bacterium]
MISIRYRIREGLVASHLEKPPPAGVDGGMTVPFEVFKGEKFMKTKLCLLALIAILLPLALGRSSAPGEDSASGFIVRGTVVSESNLRNRTENIPNKWLLDISGSGTSDLVLFSTERDEAGSEFVQSGMRVEAEIRLKRWKPREYELVRWIRFGQLP